MAGQMLGMKANKKILQHHLLQKTGKHVLLRDLHNLNSANNKCGVDFDSLLKEMKTEEGATVETLVDEKNVLRGVFYQDQQMKKMFESFPEMILIDATYKLNNLRMPLYVILVVDGNGESEIVALWFVSQEDRETTRQMVKFFTHHNPKCSEITVVMGDKDMTERDVIKEELPDAQLLICLFHTLKTFKREISTSKMGISQDQRLAVLEVISRLVHSSCERDYMNNYGLLKDMNISGVNQYFDKNWHPIRSQWVEGLKDNFQNFMTRTNNRLESMNQKLKSVITKHSSMVVFWRDLIKCVKSFSIERNYRADKVQTKVPISFFSSGSLQNKYLEHLTPFANDKMKKQIDLSESDVVQSGTPGDDEDDDTYRVKPRHGDVQEGVKVNACTCRFWKTMCLPCHHILACRTHVGMDAFVPELCARRLTRENFLRSHRVFLPESAGIHVAPVPEQSVHVVSAPAASRILSGHEKYRKAIDVLQNIATVVAEMGMKKFRGMMQMLETIEGHVKEGRDFIVMETLERSGDSAPVGWSDSFDSTIADNNSVTGGDSPSDVECTGTVSIESPTAGGCVGSAWPKDGPHSVVMETLESCDSQAAPETRANGGSASRCIDIGAVPEFESESYAIDETNNQTTDGTNDQTSDGALGYDNNTTVNQATLKERFLEYMAEQADGGSLRENAQLALSRRHKETQMMRYRTKNDIMYEKSRNHAALVDLLGGDVEEFYTQIVQHEESLRTHVNETMEIMDSLMNAFAEENRLVIPDVFADMTEEELFGKANGVVEDSSDSRFVEQDVVLVDSLPSITLPDEDLLSKIKMPTRMKRKGRPKGNDLTVIGLPRKKAKVAMGKKKKPTSFIRLSSNEKERVILKWFLKDEDIIGDITTRGRVIYRRDLKRRNMIPHKCITEDVVSVQRVKKYFSTKAWSEIEKAMDSLKKATWNCHVCSKRLDSSESVGCDACLEWYHLSCIGLSVPPKAAVWVCRSCYL